MSLNTHSLDLEAGSSQYASRADIASLSFTGDWTFEFNVKIESLPGVGAFYVFLSKDDTGERSYSLQLMNDGGTYKIQAEIFDAAEAQDSVRHTWAGASAGTWFHIAVTCDVSAAVASQFEYFIDGSSAGNGDVDADNAVSAIKDSAAAFAIGSKNTLGTPERFFDGLIDDVRVWRDIRTPTEISDNYQKQLVGNETDLMGYWKLNNDYTDSQVSGLSDLTASGSPVFSSDVPFPGTAESGFLAIL